MLERLLERVRGERAREAVPGGAFQPEAGIFLDVRLRDRELHAAGRIHHRGHGRDGRGGDVLEVDVVVAPLVVGEEALLLREEDAEVAGEVEAHLLRVHLHLRRRQRRLDAVGHALVVGAEDDRPSALHVEPQLVEALAQRRRFLTDGRLQRLVHAARPRGLHAESAGSAPKRRSKRCEDDARLRAHSVLKKKSPS